MKLASICTVTLVASLVIAQVFAADCPTYRFLVFSDTADRAAGLQNVVQQFKDELGGVSNGNALGPIGSGQRSVSSSPLAVGICDVG